VKATDKDRTAHERAESKRRRPDIILPVVTLLLITIGTVMIYSSSSIIASEKFLDEYYFLKRQVLFVFLGLGTMVILSKFPYYYWEKFAYMGIFLSLVLLSLLFVPGLGIKVGGATRWLKIGGFSFQVTEVVKVAMVIFLAHYLTKKIDHVKKFSRIFVIPLSITTVIVCLILLQPDFGTSVIIVTAVMIMFYLAGSRVLHLALLVSLLVPFAVVLVISESYRLQRWLSFCNPWKDPTNTGFHIIQSFLSFGSGGTFGVGIGNGMQKLFYLPEPHTDFILSVIAEEAGFIGVTIIVVLFAVLVARSFMISFNTPDLFGTLLSAGLTIILVLEAFVNMAAVMGLIPTKGLVLPFLSYGGTSMLMSMAAVGIILNISSYRSVSGKGVGT
jgi:cell division protein FtsW